MEVRITLIHDSTCIKGKIEGKSNALKANYREWNNVGMYKNEWCRLTKHIMKSADNLTCFSAELLFLVMLVAKLPILYATAK